MTGGGGGVLKGWDSSALRRLKRERWRERGSGREEGEGREDGRGGRRRQRESEMHTYRIPRRQWISKDAHDDDRHDCCMALETYIVVIIALDDPPTSATSATSATRSTAEEWLEPILPAPGPTRLATCLLRAPIRLKPPSGSTFTLSANSALRSSAVDGQY